MSKRVRAREERKRRMAGSIAVSGKQIEERRAALQRQGQELDRRLVEIDRQGQQLQQERGQVIANMNAVSGALQLCEELLRGLVNPTPEPVAAGPAGEEMTLDELKERLGADAVEVVPEQGQDED